MSKIICHVEECKNNNNNVCTKEFMFVNGGICSELVDRNGRQKPPQEWVKQEIFSKNSQ